MSNVRSLSVTDQCQKILKLSNKNSTLPPKIKGNNKVFDDTSDFLVVTKIPVLKEINECELENPSNVNIYELPEETLLATEYESVVKKQLQMLQADERGRIALNNEIAEIKKLQKKRAEILNARKRSMEIEKERSKRIAALPTPLPRSIKLLLKEKDNKESEFNEMAEKQNPDIPFDGLQGIAVHSKKDCILINSEDKENMLSDEEREKRERIQTERDMNAKRRFNEALKKDRLKQEYAETLKEIENAEQANRRQQAKNISSKGGTVPCYFPDKFKNSERQVKMEDAVENIYRNDPKEHAIEDLDGYEDQWEIKYKNIDTNMSNKMTDCIPNFLKENYSYLLEDETSYQCGKRFTGLDESSNLNIAYIESPTDPSANISTNVYACEDIDAIISKLDKMRAETDAAYENEFKPLLEQKKSVLKPSFMDKAVETHILKQPTEDKSVENCNILGSEKIPSATRSVQVDLLKGGILGFQRRDYESKFELYNNAEYTPHSNSRAMERQSPQRNSPLEYWSSSSYMSLPPNHGMPNICKLCDSPSCDLPIAETQTTSKDCIPLSKAPSEDNKMDSVTENKIDLSSQQHLKSYNKMPPYSKLEVTPDITEKEKSIPESKVETDNQHHKKAQLSYYIQQVADKYLMNKNLKVDQDIQASNLTDGLDVACQTSAFLERKSDSPYLLVDEKSKKSTLPQSCINSTKKQSSESRISELSSDKQTPEKSQSFSDISLVENVFYPGTKSTAKHSSKMAEGTCDSQVNRIPNIVISREMPPKQYKYHELSTIPEMDSALTNASAYSFRSSLGEVSKENKSTKNSFKERQSHKNINVSNASLINIPHSEISESAKNIKFVEAIPEPKTQTSTMQSMISGALTPWKTPKSFEPSETETPRLSPSLYMTPSSNSSRSYELATPHLANSERSVSSRGILYSPETPYSSSFRDLHRKPPYLTHIDSFPRYFEDVSSVRDSDRNIKYHGGFQMTPLHSDTVSFHQKNPTDVQRTSPRARNADKQSSESSVGSFKTITPCSYISSSSDTIQQNSFINKEAKMITEKDFGNENKSPALKQQDIADSTGSFKPPTPVSYLSDPSETNTKRSVTINHRISIPIKHAEIKPPFCNVAKEIDNIAVCMNSDAGFTNITPRSYISSTSQSQHQSPLKPKEVQRLISEEIQPLQQKDNSENINECRVDSLSSLNIHSRISFPHSHKVDADTPTSSQGSFQPLSPNSNFSSSTGNDVQEDPLPNIQHNVHLKTPIATFTTALEPDMKSSNNQHLNYHFTVEDDSHLQQSQFDNLPCNPLTDVDARTSFYSKGIFNFKEKNPLNEKYLKSGKLPYNSDFFAPQLSQNNSEEHKLKIKTGGSDFNSHLNRDDFQTFKEQGEEIITTNWKKVKESPFSECKKSDSEIQNADVIGNKPETFLFTLTDQYFQPVQPDIHKKEAASSNTSPHRQLITPISSSGDSSGAFSALTGFQSTPGKSLEEIIQEPGIVEEPDLTLFRSEFTLKPESPEKTHSLFNKKSCKPIAAVQFKDKYHFQHPNIHKQPASTYCDSPSMLSFLKHEVSCFSDATPEASPTLKSQALGSKKTFDKIEKKTKQMAKKTPGKEYKSRTKRLWNNLEEVKSRRLIEERKEQMKKNRLKMLAYAKKTATPIRKN